MINLSNSTPPAPGGGINVQWQQDAGGDVSAYVPLGGVGAKTTVAPVAGALTIDCTLGNSFFITVNAAITSMTLTGMVDGQEITLLFAQDSSGHTVATSTSLLGNFSITTTANKHSCYKWTYNAADNNWYQIGANNM